MKECKSEWVIKAQIHLSKNIITYTFISIFLGIATGYIFNVKAGWLILPLVFLMVYPMMTDVSLSSLRLDRIKPLCIALFLNFLLSPVLMLLLSGFFVRDGKIKVGLNMLAVAPSSSMGLGFIGLSGGDMAARAIVATAFLLSTVIYPLAGSYFARRESFNVPQLLIFKSLVVAFYR